MIMIVQVKELLLILQIRHQIAQVIHQVNLLLHQIMGQVVVLKVQEVVHLQVVVHKLILIIGIL